MSSIAFSVNAGPLSQIGLELAALPTAYQLATGAYGWYKARERSKSLQELLVLSGGELVSTSSFNLNRYTLVRNDHTSLQGVVVQEYRVQRTSLPKGSTAIPGHPGIACLRALTTALLCIYKLEAVVEVLQDLIPFALVQLHQEDVSLTFEDALLSSLNQWVNAVALEEDSDMFRTHVLDLVSARRTRLMGTKANNILDLDQNTYNEIPLVIGVLRWILTPAHKRATKQYPTRSLQAWMIASVMEIIGFEVHADSEVAESIQEYERSLRVTCRFGDFPHVYLVVVNGEETDLMPVVHIPRSSNSPKPQITMIRGIPWMMFKHLRRSSTESNTQHLADIWMFSYRNARACFRGVSMASQNVGLDTEEPQPAGVSEHHKSLISEFAPNLDGICSVAMRHFIPMSSSSPGWSIAEIRTQLNTLGSTEQNCYQCYILFAIVSGAIYGLCSNVCLDNGEALSEDSEVAFTPDILFHDGAKKIKEWASNVGSALKRNRIPLNRWSELLFEMFLGKETQSSARASMNAASTTTYMNMQNPHQQCLYLGAQANGMAAVADPLVKLSVEKDSFCYLHISRGQILSFPLTEHHYIEASSHIGPALTLGLDPKPNTTALHRFDTTSSEYALRVDVEPSWVTDPRTVLFVLRSHGVPIATLNISVYLDKVSYDRWACKCQEPSWEVPVRPAEGWQLVTLHQLLRTRFKGMSFTRVDVSIADTKILIDASHSVAATIYAICILHVRDLVIVEDCLTCAYEHAMRNIRNSNVTLLITC